MDTNPYSPPHTTVALPAPPMDPVLAVRIDELSKRTRLYAAALTLLVATVAAGVIADKLTHEVFPPLVLMTLAALIFKLYAFCRVTFHLWDLGGAVALLVLQAFCGPFVWFTVLEH